MTASSTSAGLAVRLLGGLEVRADGRRLELPASRKTRALLGYLILTGSPQRRDRLCELLWDVPDDPRELFGRGAGEPPSDVALPGPQAESATAAAMVSASARSRDLLDAYMVGTTSHGTRADS